MSIAEGEGKERRGKKNADKRGDASRERERKRGMNRLKGGEKKGKGDSIGERG